MERSISSPLLQERGWHIKRTALHEQLEEGTLLFHTIFALDHAISTHHRLFGAQPMHAISKRTAQLAAYAYHLMVSTKHRNGAPVFTVYKDPHSTYGDAATQGATIAFNVLRPDGTPHGFKDVERAADARNIYVRSGSHCNPGGIANHLGWTCREMKTAYEELGHNCSNPIQVLCGRATGVVRVSLGACSTRSDVDKFFAFVREEYVDKADMPAVKEGPNVSFREIVADMESRVSFLEIDSESEAEAPLGSLKRFAKGRMGAGWGRSLVDVLKVRKVWSAVGGGMGEVGV